VPLIDASRHSVLSRAEPILQARLDAAGPWHASPRGSRALEVDAKTALTPFGMGDGGWSLNPYVGCTHACTYCYVPDVTRVERARWGSYAIAKRNLPNLLAQELRVKKRDQVFLSSATDPYQWSEARFGLTRMCLEQLLKHDWPVRILTRSPLVLRDLDLLIQFSHLQIGLSVPTLDDAARKLLEPGASPIPARLNVLRKLADAGLEPYVSFAPAYPLTGGVTPDRIANTFARAGVKAVYPGEWRYFEGIRGPLWQAVQGTDLEPLAAVVENPSYCRVLFSRLQTAFDRYEIPFQRWSESRRPDLSVQSIAVGAEA
jgi:DNA repair photolyase